MINAILTMLVIGAVLGLLLGIASKAFFVPTDQRVEKVTSMLPGYNCGGCGYAGCSGYADALVNDDSVTTVSLCKPSKVEAKQEIVYYLTHTPGPDGSMVDVKVE